MRFDQPLDHLLGTRSKVAVLRYLTTHDLELSGREIARAVGLSPKPLNRVLTELAEEGVLQQRAVGRTYLYRINRRNYLVEDILRPLFQKEQSLLKQALQEATQGLPGFLSAILFGSVARGDEENHSDIDLLIVTEQVEATNQIVAERAVHFLDRYGRVLSPIVWSRQEFRQRFLSRDDFLQEVLNEGQVIAGLLPAELVYDAT